MTLHPSDFRFHTEIPVRFADTDGRQHVNNAKYLTYMEYARMRYYEVVWGWEWRPTNAIGTVVARAELDYRQSALYGDTLTVYVRCSRIGNKSFNMDFLMTMPRAEEAVVSAEAKSVIVCFDYVNDHSIAVPDSWRTAMQVYEPVLSE